MLKNLVVGRKYYFRITIPQNPSQTPSFTIESNFHNTTYRVNGGTWTTYSGSFNFAWSNTANGYRYYDGSWHTLSVGDVIEFTGTFAFTTSTTYTFLVDLLKANGIDNPVKIELYNNLSEKTALSKNLINQTIVYGALREDIDLLTPSILFEFDSVPEFNYAYLENFKRWYFITRITCVRTNLYRLDMRVDVSETYAEDIIQQNVLITRTSVKTNEYLVDERLPVSDIAKINYSIKSGGTLKNTDLFSSAYPHVMRNILVTAINEDYDFDQNVHTIYPPTDSGLPQVSSQIGDNPIAHSFIVSYGDYFCMSREIEQQSSLASYVLSAIAFPFDLTISEAVRDSADNMIQVPFKINTTHVRHEWLDPELTGRIMCPIAKGESSGYHVLYDGILYPSDYQNEKHFLNLEPYTQLDLFIPYHGWVKLNTLDVIDDRILIYFVVDLTSGDAQVYVYNYTKQKIVYSANAQIGVKLSLTQTNMEEITKQKQANVTNLILGLVGSYGAYAVSAFAGNPLGMVAGVAGMAGSVVNYVNKNAMMIPRASGTINGDKLGLYGGNVPILKVSFREPINVLNGYAHLNGYPINEYGKLEDYASLGDGKYFEIGLIHYEPINELHITDSEITEIESLVKSGIIV